MKNYSVQSVKIGVVKDSCMLTEIVNIIKLNNPQAKIIWDPVLRSTSEFTFFDVKTLLLLGNVLNTIDLITPNYIEYQVLKDNSLIKNENKFSILIKGGHRQDKTGTDILIEAGNEISLKPNNKSSIYYPKHGSGCVLSSAIACWLGKGENMEASCRKGKIYIEKFLKSNPSLLGFHSY